MAVQTSLVNANPDVSGVKVAQQGRSSLLFRNGGRVMLGAGLSGVYGFQAMSGSTTSPANSCIQAYRKAITPLIPGTAIKAMWSNDYQGPATTGEQPSAGFWISACVQIEGPAGVGDQTPYKIPIFFRGKRWYRFPGAKSVIECDEIEGLAAWKGQPLFITTDTTSGILGGPTALVLTSTLVASGSGGSIPAGTYGVAISYVGSSLQPDGSPNETQVASGTSTGALSGSTSSLTVTSPAANTANALQFGFYNIYMTNVNAAPGTASLYYLCNNAPIPIGDNWIITALPNSNSQAAANFVPTQGGCVAANGDYNQNSNGTYYTQSTTTLGNHVDFSPMYGPHLIFGQATGNINPVALGNCGDSTNAGTYDGASGRWYTGGVTARIAAAAGVPMGWLAKGGELYSAVDTLQNYSTRMQVAKYLTHIIDTYGTNDITAGADLATLQVYILRMAQRFTDLGCRYMKTTILPRVNTDTTSWFTNIADQVQALSATNEATRKSLNTWLRSTVATPAAVTVAENYNPNVLNGGTANGSIKVFGWSQAFVIGSESIVVNGVAQTPPTGASPTYYYTNVCYNSVTGVGIASGVTFGTAPTTGYTVTNTYQPVSNLPTQGGSYVSVWDWCQAVEVNSANTLTANGGYWLAAGSIAITSSFTSITNSTTNNMATLNDTSQAMTVNQYVGAMIVDTSTTTLFGSVISNTATAFTMLGAASWGGTDNYQCMIGTMCADGTHMTSSGAAAIAGTFPYSWLNT